MSICKGISKSETYRELELIITKEIEINKKTVFFSFDCNEWMQHYNQYNMISNLTDKYYTIL